MQVRAVWPKQQRLAVDNIHAHLDADIVVSDITEAGGRSTHSLNRSFQHASDTSPMQYVQRLRPYQIRARVAGLNSKGVTISGASYQWGYRHFGEFHRKYHDRFWKASLKTRKRNDIVD